MSDPIEDYIQANRDKFPREALTEQMVAAGYDRNIIEAAWNRLTPTSSPSPQGPLPGQIPGPIVVRSYQAKTQAEAALLFQADAAGWQQLGYHPISQSWAPGQWGCGAFLIALLLAIVLIGIVIFIYLLIVKPNGTLTVTYEFRAATT